MSRLRAAFRTNEPQAMAVTMLTLLNAVACVKFGPVSWGVWVAMLSIYPAIAFIGNLVSPIPQD